MRNGILDNKKGIIILWGVGRKKGDAESNYPPIHPSEIFFFPLPIKVLMALLLMFSFILLTHINHLGFVPKKQII